MDIVLGVSLTPKTVRLVLVEGVQGDGAIIDHDTFEVPQSDDAANSTNVVQQVVAAILGTQESAREGGHDLKAIGVTWSDRADAAKLRDGLAAHGIKDAMLVSELHAAGALAQTAGRAVGYESTALLFLDRDTATLSVVNTDDGSIVKVLSRDLHGADAMGVLAEMASAVAAQDSPPQGMFVVGSGVDVASVKSHLQDLVPIPVNAPEESGLALARGAALAAAAAPEFDASTVGLAYSQDPDGATSGNDYPGLAGAATQLRPIGAVGGAAAFGDAAFGDAAFGDDAFGDDAYGGYAPDAPDDNRKPFLLVGSALTTLFVVGVVALVISLAVSIRPTADQRPDAGQSAIVPSAIRPAAPAPEVAQPPAPAPEAPPAPAPETIKAPIPVVQEQPQPQAPPRTVYVEQPAAPAPAPAAPPPAPAPAAPPPAPVPAVVPIVPPVWQPPIWNPPVQQNPWPQWPRPQQQWPSWPQQPQQPQWPQQPQQPQRPPSNHDDDNGGWPGGGNGGGDDNGGWPGNGGNGNGNGNGGWPGNNGNGNGNGNGGWPGNNGGGNNGGGGGGNCFLIFCGGGGGGGNGGHGGGGRH